MLSYNPLSSFKWMFSKHDSLLIFVFTLTTQLPVIIEVGTFLTMVGYSM
jgi:hypothetical protein